MSHGTAQQYDFRVKLPCESEKKSERGKRENVKQTSVDISIKTQALHFTSISLDENQHFLSIHPRYANLLKSVCKDLNLQGLDNSFHELEKYLKFGQSHENV